MVENNNRLADDREWSRFHSSETITFWRSTSYQVRSVHHGWMDLRLFGSMAALSCFHNPKNSRLDKVLSQPNKFSQSMEPVERTNQTWKIILTISRRQDTISRRQSVRIYIQGKGKELVRRIQSLIRWYKAVGNYKDLSREPCKFLLQHLLGKRPAWFPISDPNSLRNPNNFATTSALLKNEKVVKNNFKKHLAAKTKNMDAGFRPTSYDERARCKNIMMLMPTWMLVSDLHPMMNNEHVARISWCSCLREAVFASFVVSTPS
jgi:hypothetical protein